MRPQLRILDACCGQKEWWRGKDTTNVTFLDILESVKPSVRGTMAHLPFCDGVFDEIWCDPPHLIRNDIQHWNPMYLRYGRWRTRNEWLTVVHAIGSEFWRVARSHARLVMKVIDGSIDKHRRTIQLNDLEPIEQYWTCTDVTYEKTKIPWSTAITVFAYYRRRGSSTLEGRS